VNILILQPNEVSSEDGADKTLKSYSASIVTSSDCEEENMTQISSVVNKRRVKSFIISLNLKQVLLCSLLNLLIFHG